jgi:hypothetical protein
MDKSDGQKRWTKVMDKCDGQMRQLGQMQWTNATAWTNVMDKCDGQM